MAATASTAFHGKTKSAKDLRRLTFAVVVWITLSGALILLNKYILSVCAFSYPVFLTTYHMLVATIGTRILRRKTSLLSSIDKDPMDLETWKRTILPLGVLFSLSLALANYAYLHLSVSFVQMLKASIPVVVNVMSTVAGLSEMNPITGSIMVMIGIGCAIAGFGELKYNVLGLACQLSAILAESTRLVLMDVLLSHRKLGPLVAVYYYAPVCLGCLAIALPLVEGSKPFLALPELGWGLLILNGAVAFALNIAGVNLIQAAGSLVLTLSGIMKDVILIVLSVLLLGSAVTLQQVIGYTIAVLGLAAFKFRVQVESYLSRFSKGGNSYFRARPVITVAIIAALVAMSGFSWHNMDRDAARYGFDRFPDHNNISVDLDWTFRSQKGSEGVTVLLTVDDQLHKAVYPAIHGILSTTLGPYELICTFNNQTTHYQQSVASAIRHHIEQSEKTSQSSLTRFRTLRMDDPAHSNFRAWEMAAQMASYDNLAMLAANDQIEGYAWDQTLIRAMASDGKLFAVSGRGAANVQAVDDHTAVLIDTIGFDEQSRHYDGWIAIRHVAFAGPVMYRTPELQSLRDLPRVFGQTENLDLEPCILARVHLDMFCGFYPIRSKTRRILESEISLAFKAPTDGVEAFALSAFEAEPMPSVPFTHIEPSRPLRTIGLAFSDNHQKSADALLSTLHHSTNTRIVAYILPADGEVDSSIQARYPHVIFRTFDYSRYGEWMDIRHERGQWGWKGAIVQELVEEFGGLIMWQDAGNKLFGDIDDAWDQITTQGVWSTSTADTVLDWTHPSMLADFDMPPAQLSTSNCNGAMFGFNTLDPRAMATVVRPFISCCLNRSCIAPQGSHLGNHRQDQAVLTVLMKLNGYRCDNPRGWIMEHNDVD